MGIISTEQLQEALEKSKNYVDEAAAGYLTIQIVDEIPDVEDAEDGVLYGMQSDSESLGVISTISGYSTSAYDMDFYTKVMVDGEDAVIAVGTENDMLAADFDALLNLIDEAKNATSVVSDNVVTLESTISNLETGISQTISDLEARVTALEEQVSALATSDTSDTEEEDSTEA